MKHNLSFVFIILSHLLAISKVIYDQSLLMTSLFLITYFALFIFLRKDIKLLADSFSSLYVKKKLSFSFLTQLIFLVIIMTTTQITSQILALVGIIVCEVTRMKQLPVKISEKNANKHLIAKIEEMDQHFLKIRAQRHDFLKHVHVLDHLLQKDTNAKAQQYFNELLSEYEEVNSTIKGEELHVSSLLMRQKIIAERNGVNIAYRLDTPISFIPMSMTAQVQLITNLLENAIEAAMSYQSRFGQSTVILETETHGGIYLLKLTNSAFFDDKKQLDTLFEQFGHTTKKGNHQGIGTYIIKNLVENHRGRLNFHYDKDKLTIKIKLPIVKSAAN
ncbi:sensor histidine kinase [Metabacillus litoralis]|uniref:sensor histidine kinase n=1 Tax=Metabacillus litoralis TaxID=152268 RepID=UPI001CFCFACF|nr:GHKL domain-containing protein [Metabacillus litoralis]